MKLNNKLTPFIGISLSSVCCFFLRYHFRNLIKRHNQYSFLTYLLLKKQFEWKGFFFSNAIKVFKNHHLLMQRPVINSGLGQSESIGIKNNRHHTTTCYFFRYFLAATFQWLAFSIRQWRCIATFINYN